MRQNRFFIALCFIIGLASGTVLAQLPEPVQSVFCSARLEAVASGGIANVSSDDDFFDYNSRPSIMLGAWTPLAINNVITLKPGAFFETRGTSEVYTYDYSEFEGGRVAASNAVTEEFKTIDRRSLLSFPWQIAVSPIPQLGNLQISAGMNNSILLGQRVEFDRPGGSETRKGDMGNLRTLNFGILAGVSYRITDAFSAGVLYDHGLTNISKVDGVEFRDRVVRFTLAYTFHFNPLFFASYSKAGRQKMKMYK